MREDSAESSADPTLADAAVELAEASLADKKVSHRSMGANRRTLFVHLLQETPLRAELQDGTSLCGASLLRLACDSGVVAAHKDGEGNVLDIGRRRRTVPPALARALQLRDRGCRFPGCTHTSFVDAHHIDHWAQGGATSLRNLVLVCHTRHVALHEGGFAIRSDAAGKLRFVDPDGRTIEHSPRPPVVGALGAEEEARLLRIGPMTAFPRRSFIRPDWEGCVRALAWRQHRAELARAELGPS